MTVQTDTKELVYWTKGSLWTAVGCILAMTIGAWAISWSQNHTYEFDFLLYGTLIPILLIFMIRSFAHQDKEELLFWIVRQKAMSRTVALFFAAIAIFGVNSSFGWVSVLHIIATLGGILSAHAFMVLAQTEKKPRTIYLIASCATFAAFLVSYFTNVLTIAQGEAIVSAPITIWILTTTKY